VAAQAAEVDVNGTAEVEVNSSHIWRGQILNEEPVIQPSLTLDLGPYFSAIVWGTWDLTDQPGTMSRNRVDATVACNGVHGKNIIKTGAIAYIYHDSSFSQNEDTYEVFAGYTMDEVSLPSVRVFYDLGDVGGLFGTLSFAHSFDLVQDQTALDFRVGVSVADEKNLQSRFTIQTVDANSQTNVFVPEGTKVLDITASMELLVFFGDDRHGLFNPGVSHMMVMDSDIRNALKKADEQSDETVFSVSLGYVF